MLNSMVARLLTAILVVGSVVMMFGPVLPPGVSWT